MHVSFPMLRTASCSELCNSSYDKNSWNEKSAFSLRWAKSCSLIKVALAKRTRPDLQNAELRISLLKAFRTFDFDSVKTSNLRLLHITIIQWLKIENSHYITDWHQQNHLISQIHIYPKPSKPSNMIENINISKKKTVHI